MERELDEEELQDFYAWIDKIPLSRPKRNITNDFSDGVMAAEVVKHFFPKLIDLHNYTPASSTQQKLSNWSLLNRKVFSKLNFHVPEKSVKKIALRTAGVIESVLTALREKIDQKLEYNSQNDLEYYDTSNAESSHTDLGESEVRYLSQMASDGLNKDDKLKLEKSRIQNIAQFYSNLDPPLRKILKEKEHAAMALQETVEVCVHKWHKLCQQWLVSQFHPNGCNAQCVTTSACATRGYTRTQMCNTSLIFQHPLLTFSQTLPLSCVCVCSGNAYLMGTSLCLGDL
ncbi:sperm flagellar protein 1 isoform X3 [Nerophis lumbriciformis]|uniref:sperm flagellar protein 1 isoform X3 n=1 Tax=Nerophis lumbriciformis TaxID=546530 RepID=UPI002ADF2608|nr:sperm flagellar protein 1 isoform X3 [Nerophis lumbriciformis]